jgi:1-acyl-sn-glycerol-3-phosphate acyltransferase
MTIFLQTFLWTVLIRCSYLETTFAFVPNVKSRIPVVRRRGPENYKSYPSLSKIPSAASVTTTNLFRVANVNGDAVATSDVSTSLSPNGTLSPLVAALTKAGMIAFIVGMCLALPATLYPQKVLYRLGLISKRRKERWALSTSQFCSRNLLRLFPFCSVETIGTHDDNPQPAIWVCNHTSMLDVFLLMAADRKLRGRKRRPIKIVYWKNLEDNPVTKLMFRQAGFIPVAMAPNKPGEDNEYDKASFKLLLKDVKRAFEEDFDVALLPEGQLNPTPELGLQPIFGGAYTLAKMSRRPIYMMALYGIHKLWHPDEEIGMTVTSRHVKIRTYPNGRNYSSAEEFKTTFEKVVGKFGATGRDLPDKELNAWLNGDVSNQKP